MVYIGKAGTTLRKRLNQYLKFGNRQNIGHWGGRYIWQIKIPAICCCAGNLLPTKIPKRSKPHSSPDSKNSAGDTDHSPISKIKGRGDLYVESRQKFYFALIPILDKLHTCNMKNLITTTLPSIVETNYIDDRFTNPVVSGTDDTAVSLLAR